MANKVFEKSFFAGFGGQGIILMGQVWVYFAIREGRNGTFFPFYGAEKRGGIARASVIISDDEIDSPLVVTPDSVVVMNIDSFPLCEGIIKSGGLMLINSTLVKDEPKRTDIKAVKIEATAIAEKLGDVRAANMVALGALAKATGAIALSDSEGAIRRFFPTAKSNVIDLNVEAIKAGFDSVK